MVRNNLGIPQVHWLYMEKYSSYKCLQKAQPAQLSGKGSKQKKKEASEQVNMVSKKQKK